MLQPTTGARHAGSSVNSIGSAIASAINPTLADEAASYLRSQPDATSLHERANEIGPEVGAETFRPAPTVRAQQSVPPVAIPLVSVHLALSASLSWWRGAALAEFADGPWARAEALRLEELRVVGLEELAAARLASGHAEVVVGDLGAAGPRPAAPRPTTDAAHDRPVPMRSPRRSVAGVPGTPQPPTLPLEQIVDAQQLFLT